MATSSCMQRHVCYPKKFCRIAAANSVPVLCELFEIRPPYSERLTISFSLFFHFIRSQHFYGFLCVTISLSYAARICKHCGYSIVYLRCFGSYNFPFAYILRPFISPEESHTFSAWRSNSIRLCLPKHVTLGAFKTKNVSRTTPPPPPASRLWLGINYKQSWLHSDERK